MYKKAIIILFILVIVNPILGNGESKAAQLNGPYLVKVPIDTNNPYVLKTDYPLALISTQTIEHLGVIDTRYIYRVRYLKPTNNNIVVTKRTLPNGDYFVFTTIRNRSTEEVMVELIIKGISADNYTIDSFDQYPITKNSSPTVGMDPTTYPVGVVGFSQGTNAYSYMIGKAYSSKENYLRYKNGSVSLTRELLKEENPLKMEGTKGSFEMSFTFSTPSNSMTEHWLVSSNTLLFENHSVLLDWMKESAINYRKTNAWYTENGPYNKMVETIEPQPASELGYGRTLLLVKEDKALEWYKETNERYFEDLVYNSLMNLNKFKDGELFWETEVTSTYLKNLYGITAPFIDTRFNELTALFVRDAGEYMKIEGLNRALLDYADLLVQQVSSNNIIPAGKGYFIPDYFPTNQKVITHMSLNHGLGGMNLLLEAYQESGKEKYLNVAKHLRWGLEATVDEWIRDDHDLWYKITPNHQYAGRDYTYLTLEDLLKSFRLWSEIQPNQTEVIEHLIERKLLYLKENHYPLSSFHKKELKELGFPF